MELNKIYNGNCVDIMKNMDDNSIDLTVTSPPYADMRKYTGEGTWNYNVFKMVAEELYRITKNGGVVVWNVNDKTEKGSETGDSFRQALYFMECGFNLNDTMIWQKSNSMPQVSQPRYNQCFEYMFVFSKGKPKTFNPIMIPCKCAGQSYDSTCKNMGGENGRTEKHFKINKEKVDNNIWEFAVAQNRTEHPAVFPIELPIRHIKSWTSENDIVFDPFIGSGTTAIAAKTLNRNFIGIDISEKYCKIAEEQLKKIY